MFSWSISATLASATHQAAALANLVGQAFARGGGKLLGIAQAVDRPRRGRA
jgi:hypothetical protein